MGVSGVPLRFGAWMLALSLSFTAVGCLSPLNKQSVALSSATTPVVTQAASAYQGANALHNLREDYDAVQQFDDPNQVYNPRNTQPLLSDKDLHARLAVLSAFQLYAKTLVAITNNTDSPELQAASKSLGDSLTANVNTIAPSIETAAGITPAVASTTETTVTNTSGNTTTTTTSTSTTPAPVITQGAQNAAAVAIDALGQYLVSRKIKKELPAKIEAMDPHVQTLCKLLEDDIGILQDQEKRDYDRIIDLQTLFLRENKTMDPLERRTEIMKLPEIARQQQAAEQQLSGLHGAIVRLELTHHALAAEAQGNNPEGLKDKLADLESAAGDLGKFYSSVSAEGENKSAKGEAK
jgi:hypothetical protein